MPKRITKRSLKGKRKKGTRKQKPIMMVGCAKKNSKSCKKSNTLNNAKSCPNCGPNCHCGPNCKCKHPCPGNCYLNRRLKGGSGCGSCGCPLSPLSWNQMNKFGGTTDKLPNLIPDYVDNVGKPVIQSQTGNFTSIPGINQNGGTTCGACSSQAVQSGGSFYKPIGPMPGPFTGSAWSSNLGWPGMNGIGGDKNYLSSYSDIIQNDPTRQQLTSDADAGYKTMNSMVGGYIYDKTDSSTSTSTKKYKKGGGLIPQDLVNLGRDFTYNFQTAYNALNGYKAPVNPLPYKGQLTGELNNNKFLI